MSEPSTTNALPTPNEKVILLATIDLPTDQRSAYLDNACGEDQQLKARVKELLKNAVADGSFMAQPAGNLNPTTAMASIAVGGRIGRYRLLEQVGEGGMGVVYVAEQIEPVRRKVALKVIKPGMDSKQVIARFEAERQALAMMEHSNIARVLDAGTTEHGLPYFVMELVRGLPITEFCDRAKADTRQRLELFVAVCNAVHHAHQKGIIHRDIKPSNVLVTLHDGTPIVKVIDFGVAKALHQQLSNHTIYTALNQVVGTPLYMSPEQMELSGLDIDTRTDIYSLGVLLYELLTGFTPFDRARLLKSGFDEMRRIIREEEPPRPSQRITTLPKAELSTVANKRGLDECAFTRSVRSELDWITLKALEKDRNRRYESASAFGDDIQRFLDDESVLACPPSFAYQFQKLIRRHRAVVAISGAVLLSLLVGLTLTAWQWRRAVVAERQTENALELVEQKVKLANKRLSVAEQAIDDMYTQFAQDWLSQQSQLTQVQRQFLEKAAAAYDQLAAQDPSDAAPRLGAIVATLRAGSILKGLGRFDEAKAKLELAIDMANAAQGISPNDVDVRLNRALARGLLGNIYRNRANPTEKLKLEDAAYAELIEIGNKPQLSEHQRELLSKCLSNNAIGLSTESTRKTEASRAADLGVAIARQLWEAYPEDLSYKERLAASLSAKGQQCLWWGEQNDECLKAYQESVELKLQLTVENPERQIIVQSLPATMNNLAVVLRRLKRVAEADSITVEELEILRKLVARFPNQPEYQSELGETLRTIGNIEHRRGNSEKADEYWSESKATLSDVVARFPDLRSARRSLALALRQFGQHHLSQGENPQAAKAFEAAVAQIEQFIERFPDDTEMYVIQNHTLRSLAVTYLKLGDHEKASVTAQDLAASLDAELISKTRVSSYEKTLLDVYGNSIVLVSVSRILANCSKIVNAISLSNGRTNKALDQKEYAHRSEIYLNRATTLINTWMENRMSPDEDWSQLLIRIDATDTWKTHGREPTLENFFEDSQLQARRLLVDAYVAKYLNASPLPDNWPSVALALASAKEYSLNSARQLAICQRGMLQTPNAPLASQAYAWNLYRSNRLTECRDALIGDGQSASEDGFVLSMAFAKLGEPKLAREKFEEAASYIEANRKMLVERRSQKPLPAQPNIETLLRLKSEAAEVIGDDDEQNTTNSN